MMVDDQVRYVNLLIDHIFNSLHKMAAERRLNKYFKYCVENDYITIMSINDTFRKVREVFPEDEIADDVIREVLSICGSPENAIDYITHNQNELKYTKKNEKKQYNDQNNRERKSRKDGPRKEQRMNSQKKEGPKEVPILKPAKPKVFAQSTGTTWGNLKIEDTEPATKAQPVVPKAEEKKPEETPAQIQRPNKKQANKPTLVEKEPDQVPAPVAAEPSNKQEAPARQKKPVKLLMLPELAHTEYRLAQFGFFSNRNSNSPALNFPAN